MRSALAVALACAAAILLFASLLLMLLDDRSRWWALASPVIALPAAVGVVIVLRRPGNAIGWVLLVDSVVVGVDLIAAPYAHYGLITNPGALAGARWAVLWDAISWPTLFAGATFLVFLFPEGRVPSGRWRATAKTALVILASLIVLQAFQPQHYDPPFRGVESPLPTISGWLSPMLVVAWIGFLASPFAAVAAVRARFRRAEGVERLQFLWLAYASLTIPVALVVCVAEDRISGSVGIATAVMLVVALSALPVAVAIAVFRYRLFDIEVLISRTLVYGLLSLAVVGGYVGLVVALDAVVHVGGVAGAVSAALVALAAQPLRHALQLRVERFVHGDRGDPYAALSRLGKSLEAAPAPQEVLSVLVDSVARALRLAYSAIELDRDGRWLVAAAHGRPGRGPRTTLPLTWHGREVGRLVVEPTARVELVGSELDLLSDLARQAGVAVHAARLTADLQRSRERLVAAREEERRRLRRDLHDGLGPALASIVLKVDAVRTVLPRDADDAQQVLDELRRETQDAIRDIRRLVYELRPPALDELGLLGALHEQATRLCDGGGVSLVVEFPPTTPDLPAAVEVATYRIAGEALMNAITHARASTCSLALSLNADLSLQIADDGRGIAADHRPGVGLASMRERAEELGGNCEIGPRPGGGTLVRALIPLADA